jgi:Cu(I)/Ag(I) efflux system membrane fusion protein
VPFLSIGQEAQARLPTAEAPPAKVRLAALHQQPQLPTGAVLAVFRLDSQAIAWQPGGMVSILVRTPLADVEPYRSLSRKPPPLRSGEPRVAYVSREHPEVVRARPGRCPIDNTELIPLNLADNQRLGWWCPMHPEVVAEEDGHACAKCGGMKLLPRIVSYAPPGTVLAVPSSSVLDTGRCQLVYVEVAPGMLEGWQVQLGTRAGDFYPVLSGLSPANRVVAAGTFLIDAETRLSGQAATAYFGATTSP